MILRLIIVKSLQGIAPGAVRDHGGANAAVPSTYPSTLMLP